MDETQEPLFSKVRVIPLVAILLVSMLFLPGFELVAAQIPLEAPDHIWLLAPVFYAQTLMAVALIACTRYPVSIPLSDLLGKKPTLSQTLGGLLLSAFLYFVSWASLYLVFLPLSFWVPEFVTFWIIELPDIVFFESGRPSLPGNLLSIISLSLLAPITEEFIFRGVLLHRFAHKYGLRSGIVYSSLLFGLLHPDILGAFLFGVGMCILYLRTQSLWVPMICHGVYNFAVWALDLATISMDEFGYFYTLEDFQNDWPYGLSSGLLVLAWAWWYLRRKRASVSWRLPPVGIRTRSSNGVVSQ